MKYKVDEWVILREFPEDPNVSLYEITVRAVILEVLEKDDQYDYRICIDNGKAKIKKVKEAKLEAI
jgi:hypothetical protein